jgi:hypothetical protein
MTLQDEIAELRARIAQALFERDAGRASGNRKRSMEAAGIAEALEAQLEQMRQEGLRATARNTIRAAGAVAAPTAGGAANDPHMKGKP